MEKIIEAEDGDITLTVPRFSHLGESLSNFHLLKREADALGKMIFVESVDNKVIELAEMSGLNGINPFFSKNKRQFSDIVAPAIDKTKSARRTFEKDRFEEEFLTELENKYSLPEINEKTSWRFPRLNLSGLNWGFYRKILLVVLILSLVGGIGFAAAQVLPRAEVRITAKKQNWNYNDSVSAEKSAVADPVAMVFPAQIFSQNKNVQLKFPATGKRKVEKFASGEITIYNSYSSDPQTLLEKTRFLAPDGKLFRLVKTLVVPGAKIIDGKIVPSSVAANVVADAPGSDYNIGPVKLFTIPGFKGTPKYQSFYGESANSMSGGFIGEIAYPTPEDIKKAKASADSSLEGGLKAALLAQVPSEFVIMDGATSYKVSGQKIDEEADKDGQFGVFTEAQATAISFRRADLENLLAKRALRDNSEDSEVKNFTLERGLARTDFDKGKISFPVKYSAVLAKKINPEEIKARIAGKSEAELKSMIFGLPGLESATISLWPFFVKWVPASLDKITVKVD